ncbi:MAG: CBS domain-containing protein [Planctomycetota bacterium]
MPDRTRNLSEFQDPLENYEPPTYDDPLEQALAEETVSVIQSIPFAKVTPATPIGEAVEMLANLHGSCLLVEDEGRLVGVFTDRDVLDKVALGYDDAKTRTVSSVMTHDPVYVYDTDSLAAALTVMAVSGFRYVPVVDHDGKILGIVSPQRVTGFLRRVFDAN